MEDVRKSLEQKISDEKIVRTDLDSLKKESDLFRNLSTTEINSRDEQIKNFESAIGELKANYENLFAEHVTVLNFTYYINRETGKLFLIVVRFIRIKREKAFIRRFRRDPNSVGVAFERFTSRNGFRDVERKTCTVYLFCTKIYGLSV